MNFWPAKSIVRLGELSKLSKQAKKRILEILSVSKTEPTVEEAASQLPEIESTTKIETRGLSMPIIGIGTWQIEPIYIESCLSYALDAGYRHIDTAYSYGNEAAIGHALNNMFKADALNREELFITSKLPFYGMSPEGVRHFVGQTLKNLKAGYLDLYLIHYPVGVRYKDGQFTVDPETDHVKIWRALEDEVCKGRIKNLGVSNFNIPQVKKILKFAKIAPANIQVELHLYHQQKEMLSFCADNAIALTAYAPLGSPGLDQFLVSHDLNFSDVPMPLKNPTVVKIARKHKKTPAHVLLRFLIQNGICVIPKSRNPDRIVRNFNVFDFSLDAEDVTALSNLDMNEQGQMFLHVWDGTEDHPEYPFAPPNSDKQN